MTWKSPDWIGRRCTTTSTIANCFGCSSVHRGAVAPGPCFTNGTVLHDPVAFGFRISRFHAWQGVRRIKPLVTNHARRHTLADARQNVVIDLLSNVGVGAVVGVSVAPLGGSLWISRRAVTRQVQAQNVIP
jgi:hypothetical protein